MGAITAQQIEDLVSLHSDIICFGHEADAVDERWISEAESRLGKPLPVSYKWFLKKYAGGEIGSEEIYSVYGVAFDSVNGGDIVYQHIVGVRNRLVDDKKLVVSESDLGEVFFFDYSRFQDGECPVRVRIPSGENINYAVDFFEFLYKRVLAHI
ncbi:SMI1/KNR4 family protein [Pseudomonas sp. SWRI196]|uniref:SMI1/KNR4 family protein n=1 Tax=Pseudomonas tehranensis TaxID=2745502 RepID=A0ABR6UPR6_9PSED|nr:SMI1/KNR4 family protein [Pseudomonas tehranensis]MBC3346502.1 SMI1/KNR4 family protein [Pseudomonas tehranensis]